MRDKIALGLGGAVVALGTAAWAQEMHVFTGGETVVTAGRLPQKVSEALRNVVVITASDIEASGQLTLSQVLQEFGGLEMVSNGGHGNTTSVFIRGANSAHTLVLVDGIRLQSATIGTTAFENIPLSQIERIEIVPGPASSLYGSDAIGGVIQIFTKGKRGTPDVEVTASAGSYATRSVKGAASTSVGSTDFTVSAGYFETNNFNITKPSVSFGRFNPDDDGYRNSNFSAKLTHRLDLRNEVGAGVFYSKGASHFDNGPTTDDVLKQTLAVYSLHSQNDLTGWWQSLLRLGASRDDSASLGAPTVSTFKTDNSQATWQNTFMLGDGSLIVGAEYLRQKIATDTAYAVNKRNIQSLFAGYNADFGRHAVQASVRRDDNSQFGAPTTGSVAYGFRITPEARIRAAYGTAFHAPSFNDLYFPGFGNPDVQPERSRNAEVGFDYETPSQRLVTTYFDNRISDLIVFSYNPVAFTFRPENVATARIRGTEFSYTALIADTRLRAKLTLQDPETDKAFQLQRRAKRHGSIVASRAFGDWRLGAEVVASGERFDSSTQTAASRMAGYAIFNLTIFRSITPEWSVDVRWNNVTGTKYELIQGFNTPGSNVLLSVNWSPLGLRR